MKQVILIGGPFDGHINRVPDKMEIPATARVPVSRAAYGRLYGQPVTVKDEALTSIAVYAMSKIKPDRYIFLRCDQPTETERNVYETATRKS